jgi:hypothetical protein
MNFDFIHINSQDRDSESASSTDFEVSLSQALEFDEIQLNILQLHTLFIISTQQIIH